MELSQFLGFASYYRHFVKDFAKTAGPLHSLAQKTRQWVWTHECDAAFATLKIELTSSPVLVYPQFDNQFILDTDASGEGLGAVLSQVTNGAERKYCATWREMLGLV